MLIKDNNDWIAASKGMSDLVKEGRKLTWKKSYNDTKRRKAVEDFKFSMIIYEVRQSRYLNVRMLGRYDMTSVHGLDELCADLFSLSLTHEVVGIDKDNDPCGLRNLLVVIRESNMTNVDWKLINAILKKFNVKI